MDIGPPWLLFISACSPQRWGLRFPTRRAESQGSLSEAVSRAQPAGAAACITATGFYLVLGGGDADRVRSFVVVKREEEGKAIEKEHGESHGFGCGCERSRDERKKQNISSPNVDLGCYRYIFVHLFVFRMVLRCDTQRNSKRESVRKLPKQGNNILYLN